MNRYFNRIVAGAAFIDGPGQNRPFTYGYTHGPDPVSDVSTVVLAVVTPPPVGAPAPFLVRRGLSPQQGPASPSTPLLPAAYPVYVF